MIPMPTQLSGAVWLASKHRALLASECRCGKTGTAILAADMILARRIKVVTTASGRAVWRRAFADWSVMARSVRVVDVDRQSEADVDILSWESLPNISHTGDPDLIILDESHRAKNPERQRTIAAYGKMYDNGEQMLTGAALVKPGIRAWHLTATPAPHSLDDLWPMLRASTPEILSADTNKGWPDVTRYDDFRSRYCVMRMKKISNWTKIPVVVGGRNEPELRERMQGFVLRHTQKDIGIRPITYETFPFTVSASDRRKCDTSDKQQMILDAAEQGRTKELEIALAELRQITGSIKAPLVVKAAKDELEGGLPKLVILFWHRAIGAQLLDSLTDFRPVLVDGATSIADRENAENHFRGDAYCRVFLGQIQACAEAIDLSSSSELWFAEQCFTPAIMQQASQRISNVNQTKNTIVKVCTIENTIDDAIAASLMRLWSSIRQVVS